MKGNIIPASSEYEKLLQEISVLQAEIVRLTALRDDLVYRICPSLRAIYEEEIGSIEREILAAQLYLQEKKRILELLRAQLNRREKMSYQKAAQQAEEEKKEYEEELKRRAKEAEQSGTPEEHSSREPEEKEISEGKAITGICTLKIINGEERGLYCRELDENAGREAQRAMFDVFEEMVGYLPIISYGISGHKLQLLEDAYGVCLGKSFSNHVIDPAKMISIHMPEHQMHSLDDCASWLGITCEAESEMERECRLAWKLYCRMDRSELQKSTLTVGNDSDT